MDAYKFGIKNQTGRVFTLDSTGSYPVSELIGSATFDSVGVNVTITGASVFRSIETGDYLYSETNSQCIRVKEMCSDGTFSLEYAFVTDVTGDDFRVIKNPKFSFIRFEVVDAAGATIDGTAVAQNQVIEFKNEEGLAPIGYDATGSEVLMTVLG
jgi:hypothetical protein